MRVQEDVGQPAAPQPGADARLGIEREVLAGAGRDVDAQGAQVARVQDVVGSEAVEIVGELGAVGVGEGVHHDVHLVGLAALDGIGQQELGVAQHVARRGDFVGVLASGMQHGGLEGRRLGARPVAGGHGGHEVHRPDRAA